MTRGGNIRITPADHPEHNGNKTYRIAVQLAAVILCSPELARSVDAWIFDHDVQLMGFNGSTTRATQYAIFSVQISVRWMPRRKLMDRIGEADCDSDLDDDSASTNDKEEVYSCIVHALIHPSAPFELLGHIIHPMAGDFIHEHAWSLIRGDRRRVAEHIPWSSVASDIARKRRIEEERNTVYMCGPLPEGSSEIVSRDTEEVGDEPLLVHGMEADLCQVVKRELKLFRSDVKDMIKSENKTSDYDHIAVFQVHEVIVDRPAEIFSIDKVRTCKQRRSRSLQCAALDPFRLGTPCVACGSELHCLDFTVLK
jgi:hypothetical protein